MKNNKTNIISLLIIICLALVTAVGHLITFKAITSIHEALTEEFHKIGDILIALGETKVSENPNASNPDDLATIKKAPVMHTVNTLDSFIDIGTLPIDTYRHGEYVLDELTRFILRRGKATIWDLYDALDLPNEDIHKSFGWLSIGGFKLENQVGCGIITAVIEVPTAYRLKSHEQI